MKLEGLYADGADISG